MGKPRRISLAVITLALLCLFNAVTSNLYCQSIDREGKPIVSLTVRNNKAVSTDTITSKIKTKVGDKFSQATLNDDLKRLYATEYFTDVSIDVEDSEGGVSVAFIVEEKSTIENITFEGNKAVRTTKLKSLMKSKVNEMLNLAILAQDIADIRNFYVQKGYPLAEIKYEVDVNKEENKVTIRIKIDEKSRVKVSRINITGNQSMKTKKITKILATKPAWLFNPGIFKDDVFEEDLEKIRALYDDEGFLDVQATPKMDYGPDGKTLEITIAIEEGKRYLVGDITVKGNLTLPEKEVRSNIKMKPRTPFSNRALRMDLMAIRQCYTRYGYMNAEIDVDRALNSKTGNIDVVYKIDAKELVYVGKIEIRGNIKTKDIVIRRELRIYPGERFDGDKIARSKERLYNLGFFEDVSFDTEPTEAPDVQDLIVTVREAKTGEFSFGGGYSSVDQLIGFVDVTQKNFDILNWPYFTGAGQNLTIRAEVGMTRANYNLSWMEPWILGYPLAFGFDLYQTSHRKDTDIGWPYDERRTGGDLKLGKEFTEHLRGDLIYKFEQVDIASVIENASQDLRNEEGINNISSLAFQLTQDTRDNIYVPKRGYVLSGSIEDAGGAFFGDKDFIKGTATAIYYHTFFEQFVLELKGRAGLANAYGNSDEVPIYERFFAGGMNTIRGYKERRVGPRDPGSDEPIGGEAIVVGNVEVTFPIVERIVKGAIFYDVGNVWRRAEDFFVGGEYKYGAGVGLRIKTPIGPINLDYGYPLVKNFEDKQQGEFYFQMSRGF